MTVVSDRPNPVIGRREVTFEVVHSQASTPTRSQVKEKLAALLNADPEALVIWRLETKINSWRTVGLAYLYDSPERARKFTPKHVLLKELPKEEREKILKGKAGGQQA